MRIAVAIASHERQQPLLVVLRCLPEDWHAVLVLSPGEDPSPYLARPNTHVHHYANSPLGAKWQHAVDMARTLEPDLLIITGSDDVLLGDTDQLAATMQGIDMLGFRRFLVYDGRKHWQCTYAPHMMMPIGGGRVYRRALLNRMRWRLFDTTREKHLDEYGFENALRVGGIVRQVEDCAGLSIVAIKGAWPQKNPLNKYLKSRNLHVTPIPHVRHRIRYQF
jgi:hypothetical protein